jgi:hypothetical protein
MCRDPKEIDIQERPDVWMRRERPVDAHLPGAFAQRVENLDDHTRGGACRLVNDCPSVDNPENAIAKPLAFIYPKLADNCALLRLVLDLLQVL